jgi:hypothetical protein
MAPSRRALRLALVSGCLCLLLAAQAAANPEASHLQSHHHVQVRCDLSSLLQHMAAAHCAHESLEAGFVQIALAHNKLAQARVGTLAESGTAPAPGASQGEDG